MTSEPSNNDVVRFSIKERFQNESRQSKRKCPRLTTMAEPPPVDSLRAYDASSLSSPSSIAPSSSSSSSSVEGYDYDFVPAPVERYRCAICLLVLREPLQTHCGHLYCRACILKWLRGSHNRCPVDNEEISEKTLFPDNFLKREIDNFQTCCPNSKQGCDVITTLKHLPDHLSECPLALVPCPNKCSNVLHRRDLDEHVQNSCDRRQVSCPDCNFNYPAIDLEIHKGVCPRGRIQCQYCEQDVVREEVPIHVNNTCPKKIVDCTFRHLGCGVQIARGERETHVTENLTHHLNLLCNGIVTIFNYLQLPALPPSGQQPVAQEMTQSEVTQVMAGVLSSLQRASLDMPHGTDGRLLSQQGTSGYFTPPSSLTSTPSPILPPSTLSVDLASPHPSHPHHHHHPTTTTPTTFPSSMMLTEPQEASLLSHRSEVSKQDEANLSPTPFSLSGKFGESSSSCSSFSKSLFGSASGSASLQTDQMIVFHTQRLVELQAKVDTLDRIYKQKMKQYDQQFNEMEGRICNGEFYWKIQNYSRYQREAERGQTAALHSQAFYTDPSGGYRLCIRANLYGVDSARGKHLSLFIHFMQGEYDDIVEWPFRGRIVLAVVDQNECCELKNHVEEVLVSKPNLAAFQRPCTPRNHKGFGYMEFLPLDDLKQSTYVKNDTLIIKAHVLPASRGDNSGR